MDYEIHSCTALKRTPVVFVALVTGNAATPINKATLDAITCKVFDVALPSVTVLEPTVSIADCVFDELQNDELWRDEDGNQRPGDGYNFKHQMPSAAFPDGGKIYQAEYYFTPEQGEPFSVAFRIRTLELHGI